MSPVHVPATHHQLRATPYEFPMRRRLTLIPFAAVLFFTVSGGAYGVEQAVSSMGPGLTLLLFTITPFIWSLPIALMVAELSAAMPVEGGYYHWVKEGLGPFWGFQQAWWAFLFAALDMAIYPVLFGDYAKYLWPGLNDWVKWGIGLAVIVSSLFINLRGAPAVGHGALIIGFFALFPFVLLFIIGMPKINHLPWEPFTLKDQRLLPTLSLGLAITMWNYQGWDNVSTFAGEVQNPRTTFPRGLLLVLPLVVISYLCALVPSLGGTVHWFDWKEGYFPFVAEQIAGRWLGLLMVLGAFGTSWALFNSQLLYASRLPYVLALEGYLPRFLGRTNRFQIPWAALVTCSAIYALLSRLNFQTLVVIDVIAYSAALTLEFIALVTLRRKQPALARPFQIPGGIWGVCLTAALPIIPVCLIVAATLFWTQRILPQLLIYLTMAASGLIVYGFKTRKPSPPPS